MNYQEFQTVITPIIIRWKTAYSGDQLKLIHEALDCYGMSDFKKVVDHLLGTQRVAPMIPDFKKAFFDLNIKATLKVVSPNFQPASSPRGEEDYMYHLRDNIWANNTFVFIRGETVKACSSINKKDYPTHPLVVEDANVRSLKIAEVKKHLENRTYDSFMNSKNSGDPVRPLNYSALGLV